MEESMETKKIGIMAFILIVVIGGALSSSHSPFMENLTDKLPITIGYIFLISLFVERAIEIFLSAWRSEGADKLDLSIAQATEELKEAKNQQSKKDITKKLNDLKKNRMNYSAKSRIQALWIGLIISVLIASVGVRILGTIVDITNMQAIQKSLFTGVDILLTSAVLAGGSDAINKLMKIFNSFMITTNNKIKNN